MYARNTKLNPNMEIALICMLVCIMIYRYLMNPNMEIVRSFGLEYNAEQLSEDIYKEFQKIET